MIEQITPQVFKAKRIDIKKNLEEIINAISQLLQCNYSAIIIQKRDDTAINGSTALVESVTVDYRSEALIVVKPGVCHE